ncbi:hypothetical protein [Eisenbergiella sp.]
MRKSIYKMVPLIVLFALLLCGCGESENSGGSTLPFPNYGTVLEQNEETSAYTWAGEAVIPARIYFDNTGSMEGFTFDENFGRRPDPSYLALIRCLRDMNRLQDAVYYTIDRYQQRWVEYEGSVYQDFAADGFHVGWNETEAGPLTSLFFEGGLDAGYVNVILTDLAEQNLNNTKLAQQIQKLCEEEDCAAELFVFSFEFHGNTQVPNPDQISNMLDERVDGKRPYYMLITGPEQYVAKYRKELVELLAGQQLTEGKDYFTATSRLSVNEIKADVSDVVFEPFADYEEMKALYSMKDKTDGGGKKYGGKNNAEDLDPEETLQAESINTRPSKNLIPYNNVSQLFEGTLPTQIAAFQYRKAEGVPEKMGDWELNFYVPLSDGKNPNITYTCDYRIYRLSGENEDSTQETETEEGRKQEEEKLREWVADGNSRVEITQEITEEYEGAMPEYPTAVFFSCKDKPAEKGHSPREKEILIIFKIMREERVPYERPEWLSLFDTSSSDEPDDYFRHTYNLIGFYDILFGYRNKRMEDDTLRFVSSYAEIPVLITDLKE